MPASLVELRTTSEESMAGCRREQEQEPRRNGCVGQADIVCRIALRLHLHVLVKLCVLSASSVVLLAAASAVFCYYRSILHVNRASDQNRAHLLSLYSRSFHRFHFPSSFLPLYLFLYYCLYGVCVVLCVSDGHVSRPIERFSFVAALSREAPLLFCALLSAVPPAHAWAVF